MTIQIGREGNQPFVIKTPLVSRIHAEADINDENGKWSLHDCDSSNGTYVRDEVNGEMRRVVGMVPISPLSFICLGTTNAKGCTFYARQLLNPGNFQEEMLYIRNKEEAYQQQLQKVEKTAKNVHLMQTIVPVILFGLLMMIWKDYGMISYIVRTVCAAIPATLIQIFFNPKKKLQVLKETMDHFRICPNPACCHELSSKDIMAADCPRCHAI